MTNTDLEQDVLVYQGDTIIIPFEYEQGELTGISDFSDYDKIEISVSSFNDFIATFSTDNTDVNIDADHLITISDPQRFDLIIPSSDSDKMLGSLLIKTVIYLTYSEKEMKFTYKFNPQIKVIE